MRRSFARSSVISAAAARWVSVSVKGSAASIRARSLPSPAMERPRPPPGGAADERQRELVRQQLVVGEARARRGVGLQVGRVFGRVRCRQRLVPGRPAADLDQPGLAPFRQRGRLRQSGAHGAGHQLQRDARRQRVDGLDRLHAVPLVERRDVIGVHHLDLAAVVLDAAAHHAHGSLGQPLAEPVALGVEEDEGEGPGLVGAEDPGRVPAVAGGLVPVDAHGERRRGAGFGLGDLGRVAPVDQARRQVPEQVHHERPGQPLDGRARANADPPAAPSRVRTAD